MSGASGARRSRWLMTYSVGVVVLAASVALPSLAFGAEDKAAAREHYETATRLYEVREYAEALKEYKAAYVAKPDPAFLFNIGQCLRKLDRNTEALPFFQQYLKKAPPDNPNRALVEARIRNIEAGLNSDYDPFDKSEAAKPAQPHTAGVTPLPASEPPSPAATPTPVPPPTARTESPEEKAQSAGERGAPARPSQPVAASLVGASPVVQPSGVDLTSRASSGEEPAPTPLLRTWWFWTGVGAVVVAGTVTAIVLASRGDGGQNSAITTLGTQTVFP